MKFDLIIKDGEVHEYLDILKGRSGVYLIHLLSSLKHANHYTGFSDDLGARLDIHHKGNADSCKLLLAAKGLEINWRLVHVWVGEDRAFERYLKNGANVSRLCPICRPDRLTYAADYMRRKRAKEPMACP